ncbi:hypothetical protein Leryth_009005 [Lithospermum erythrorhizon]|nr:hypothetical protein Leryth_009005 [Lithospermum erythrorhizon]
MGNSIQRGSLSGGGGGVATGKVILSDGTIQQYEKNVTVAELMLEYPQQLVFEVQASSKTVAMPADKMLEKNKVYLMAPMRRGRPAALSSEEMNRILSNANCFMKSKSFVSSSEGLIPLFARIWQAGGIIHGHGGGDGGFVEGQRVADAKKKSMVIVRSEELKEEIFAEFLEGRPDYLSKQLSGKGWKPSLNTINEKSVKTKVPHWSI